MGIDFSWLKMGPVSLVSMVMNFLGYIKGREFLDYLNKHKIF
jgi:hypothetical protein